MKKMKNARIRKSVVERAKFNILMQLKLYEYNNEVTGKYGIEWTTFLSYISVH